VSSESIFTSLYSKKLEAEIQIGQRRTAKEIRRRPKEFFKPRISDAPKSANQPDYTTEH
uniref:Uncharacterized protein n=1 Tax=Ditylenchus dipsaci TaxID=166011 RepID=A0A915CN84_9BILA